MPILILLSALVVVGLACYIPWAISRKRNPAEAVVNEPPEGCCGQHQICERDSLLSAVSATKGEVEYFADEELDRFAGRKADAYSDAEIEEFRDVLLTLQPDEIAPWGRSIQLRGITLPTPVRDELLLLVADLRDHPGH